MIERLAIIKKRYDEISEELLNPEIVNDYNKMKKLSIEKSGLEDTVKAYDELININTELEGLNDMLNDPEMSSIAKEEISNLESRKEELLKEIEILLIPKDENDGKDIIMEIRGAAGGDEANIFAGDLFRMYSKYAEKNNWKIEVTNSEEGTSGGYSQIEFAVKGENVYSK